MRLDDLNDMLRHNPVFRSASRAAVQDICRCSTLLSFGSGECVYESGTPADLIYLVIRGALQIEIPVHGKRRGRVVAIPIAPSILGECQVLNGLPWTGSGFALKDVFLLGLDRRKFKALLDEHANLGRLLYEELVMRFLEVIENRRPVENGTPSAYLARYVMDVHRVYGGETGAFLPLSQAELGTATSLRRETINRVVRRWADDGIAQSTTAGFRVLDSERLKAIASELPSMLSTANRIEGLARSDSVEERHSQVEIPAAG